MGIIISRTIVDSVTVTDAFSGLVGNVFESRLTPTDAWTYDISHQLSDRLTPVNTFLPATDFVRTFSDILTVKNIFGPGIDKIEYIGITIPEIDAIGDPNLPVTETPIELGPFNPGGNYGEQRVSFTSAGFTISLKAPDFGNKETFEYHRINDNTRGLILLQYRDSFWSVANNFEVQFSMLDYPELQVLRAFLRLSTGLIVYYTDIFGNTHTGFIVNPESASNSSGVGYSLSFTFQEAIPA